MRELPRPWREIDRWYTPQLTALAEVNAVLLERKYRTEKCLYIGPNSPVCSNLENAGNANASTNALSCNECQVLYSSVFYPGLIL